MIQLWKNVLPFCESNPDSIISCPSSQSHPERSMICRSSSIRKSSIVVLHTILTSPCSPRRLYRALYDPALMYYNNKIKKIRKKRNKLPPPSASSRTHLDTNEPQPLSIQGWMIRYELKTAIFQEFRQDIEAAVK